MMRNTERGAPMGAGRLPLVVDLAGVEWRRWSEGSRADDPAASEKLESFNTSDGHSAAARLAFSIADVDTVDSAAWRRRSGQHAAWWACVWLVGAASAALTWRDRAALSGQLMPHLPLLERRDVPGATWTWTYDLVCRCCGFEAPGGFASPGIHHDRWTPLGDPPMPCWGLWYSAYDPGAVVRSSEREAMLPQWCGDAAVMGFEHRVLPVEWRTPEHGRIAAARRAGVRVTPALVELADRWRAVERARAEVGGGVYVTADAEQRSEIALEALRVAEIVGLDGPAGDAR